VQLCDGKHTVQQIAEKLHALYSKAEPQRITDDLLGYLALLHDNAPSISDYGVRQLSCRFRPMPQATEQFSLRDFNKRVKPMRRYSDYSFSGLRP